VHFYEHVGAVPDDDPYGKQSSETIPYFVRYLQAVARLPPLHPKLVLSQDTKSYGERILSMAPFDAIQNLSDKASDEPKAQHEPHDPWSLIA